MNNFLIRLWCATKSGFYFITGIDQLSSWPEKQLQSTSQSQSYTHTHTHKRSWSLFGGLLLVGSITAFWIPAKPLHLKSMRSKSLRCTENGNTCSKYWSTEKAQFCVTMPDHTSYNQCFKNWTNWSLKFNLIHHYSPALLPTTYHFLQASWQLFARKMLSTTSGRQKILSKSPPNPEAWIFTLQE